MPLRGFSGAHARVSVSRDPWLFFRCANEFVVWIWPCAPKLPKRVEPGASSCFTQSSIRLGWVHPRWKHS